MARGRHRGRSIALLVLLALILIAVILWKYVFVVRSVQVTGDCPMGETEVVRTARIGFGASIFSVDGEEIEKRINATGALCLEDVRIQYPDTVILNVRARKGAAMVLHMGKLRILDAAGYVVESRDAAPDSDLVYISGMRVMAFSQGACIKAAEGQLEAYQAVMGALQSQGASLYISEMVLSDPEKIQLITRTGIRVELGDAENMENKIAWMRGTVQDLERRGEAGGILDVSSGSKADYRRS